MQDMVQDLERLAPLDLDSAEVVLEEPVSVVPILEDSEVPVVITVPVLITVPALVHSETTLEHSEMAVVSPKEVAL